MCLSAFWVFFINIFILNKFGICRDKKKPSEYQETEILLASKIGETTSKKITEMGITHKTWS